MSYILRCLNLAKVTTPSDVNLTLQEGKYDRRELNKNTHNKTDKQKVKYVSAIAGNFTIRLYSDIRSYLGCCKIYPSSFHRIWLD